MRHSLKTQLSLSYVILALVLVAAVTILINFLFQTQFKNYVMSQQQDKNQALVTLLQNQYNTADGSWDESMLSSIGVDALSQGIILTVKDTVGTILWDANTHNSGMCIQMLDDISASMQEYSTGFKGGYTNSSYPIVVGGSSVGTMVAGYYGPYYYTENDIYFLRSINTTLLVIAGAALLASIAVGAFMARRISRPLSKAVAAAGEISCGNYSHRIDHSKGAFEISQLTDTINGLAASLEQQQSLRKRMSADVAHELRTPLANLQSALEAMLDGVWLPDAARLGSCHEEILRINRLVGDLERLERIEAQCSSLQLRELELLSLLESTAKSFEPEYLKKSVALQVSGSATVLVGDRDKLSQVFVNLLSNALTYTSSGGTVQVHVADTGETLQVTVKDSGAGIAKEDLPYIFERFYRADKSRTRLTGGLGLGLTITKAIVDAHGGHIGVSSTAGQGTTFIVTLPKMLHTSS